MSTSVPPRRDGIVPGAGGTGGGAAAASSSAIPDEQALRRLFDAEHAALFESAKSQLGEAIALAPRVVETAFCNAWKQRMSLRDAAQAKTFLVDEVRHGAARALSRRSAAHRFGSHGGRDDVQSGKGGTGNVDAAQMWAEIEKTIHGGGDSGAAHAAAAEASRHEAAAHMKSVTKKKSWLLPALGLIVVIGGLVVAGVYLDRAGEDDAILTQVGSTTLQPSTQSGPGQIGNLTMADDNTKVRMGPDSKLYKPDGFPSKIHAIRFEGTAEFEPPAVTDPKALPFRVVARRTHFIGSGASFVISAYPEDSTAMVLVKNGSVTVKGEKGTQVLSAGQSLVVDAAGMHAPTDAQKETAFGWVDGRITSNKKLRDATATMLRWFNMDIKVPDLPLLEREASFNVAIDSSRAAISQIEKSAGVKFGYEGETKAFRDAKAKK